MTSGWYFEFLRQVVHLSRTIDWIAHGILDSIVDSFFPLLEEIEREVAAIEDLVLTAGGGTPSILLEQYDAQPVRTSHEFDEKELRLFPDVEKHSTASMDVRFSFQPTISLVFRQIMRVVSFHWRSLWVNTVSHPSPTQITLRRMARTRRLITSLTRLLATKSEVVAQIRKRLLSENQPKRDDNLDVAMYMGDIQGEEPRDWVLLLLDLLPRSYSYSSAFSRALRAYTQSVTSHISYPTPHRGCSDETEHRKVHLILDECQFGSSVCSAPDWCVNLSV